VNSLLNEEARQNEKKIETDLTDDKAFYASRSNQHRRNQEQSKPNNYPPSKRFEGNCYYCGKYGHRISECHKKQREEHHSKQANLTEESTQEFEAFTANIPTSCNPTEWIMDSGASHHMTHNRSIFNTYQHLQIPTKVELGNNEVIYAQGQGTITMNLIVNGKQTKGILTDVLYVPRLRKNLFSVSKAMAKGLTLNLQGDNATFYNNAKPVMTATRRNHLYYIDGRAYFTPAIVNIPPATIRHETKTHESRLRKEIQGTLGPYWSRQPQEECTYVYALSTSTPHQNIKTARHVITETPNDETTATRNDPSVDDSPAKIRTERKEKTDGLRSYTEYDTSHDRNRVTKSTLRLVPKNKSRLSRKINNAATC
jgi:hypothetical protein